MELSPQEILEGKIMDLERKHMQLEKRLDFWRNFAVGAIVIVLIYSVL